MAETLGVDGVRARRAAAARARRAALKAADPEGYRQAQREQRARTADRQAEYSRRWAERHPERLRARGEVQHHRRRARMKGADVRLVTAAELARIRAMPCAACGSRERVQADHLIPLARGGRHAIGNLIPLCYLCNPSKGARLWMEWRTSDTPRARLLFASSPWSNTP